MKLLLALSCVCAVVVAGCGPIEDTPQQASSQASSQGTTTPASNPESPKSAEPATAAKADFSIQWNADAPILALNGRILKPDAKLNSVLFDASTKVTVGDNTLSVKTPLGDVGEDQYTITGLGVGQGTLSTLQDRSTIPLKISLAPAPSDDYPTRYAISMTYLDIAYDDSVTYVTDSYAKQIHDQIVTWKAHGH